MEAVSRQSRFGFLVRTARQKAPGSPCWDPGKIQALVWPVCCCVELAKSGAPVGAILPSAENITCSHFPV